MKTARQRAEEFFPNGPEVLTKALELSFKEHARDQRHMCAEAVMDTTQWDYPPEEAHRLAMNTKAPGES